MIRLIFFSFRHIIVCYEYFGKFLACFILLNHAVYSCEAVFIKISVQLLNFGTVIVWHKTFALNAAQYHLQPQVVVPPEAAFVHLFAADIRRIIVEEGARSVIMVNKHLEVLICRFSAFDIFWEHLFFGCSKSAKKPDLIGLFVGIV